VWPGYGENMRVLEWMLGRIDGHAQGAESVIGTSPRYEDLNWAGLDFSRAQFDSVIGIDKAAWQQELTMHDELFAMLAYHLPAQLTATKTRLAAALG
jgi:phosphoenolpyruvate carboxykinase (GTP)